MCEAAGCCEGDDALLPELRQPALPAPHPSPVTQPVARPDWQTNGEMMTQVNGLVSTAGGNNAIMPGSRDKVE